MLKLTPEQIGRRVQEYLKFAQKNSVGVTLYEPKQEGIWHMVGGVSDNTNERLRVDPPDVSGRFIDAVAFAIKQNEFYSGNSKHIHLTTYVWNSDDGHIKLFVHKPIILPVNSRLDQLLAHLDRIDDFKDV